MDAKEHIIKSINNVRNLFLDIAHLLQTTESILQASYGFKKETGSHAILDSSGSMYNPQHWIPPALQYWLRNNNNEDEILVMTIPLIDFDNKYQALPDILVVLGKYKLLNKDQDFIYYMNKDIAVRNWVKNDLKDYLNILENSINTIDFRAEKAKEHKEKYFEYGVQSVTSIFEWKDIEKKLDSEYKLIEKHWKELIAATK